MSSPHLGKSGLPPLYLGVRNLPLGHLSLTSIECIDLRVGLSVALSQVLEVSPLLGPLRLEALFRSNRRFLGLSLPPCGVALFSVWA